MKYHCVFYNCLEFYFRPKQDFHEIINRTCNPLSSDKENLQILNLHTNIANNSFKRRKKVLAFDDLSDKKDSFKWLITF